MIGKTAGIVISFGTEMIVEINLKSSIYNN